MPSSSSSLPIIFLSTVVRMHLQPLPATPPKAGLSLCKQQMIDEIADWEVLEKRSLSDRQYIEILIDPSVMNCTFTGYKTLHGNYNNFLKNLKPYVNSIMEAIRNSLNKKNINEATNLLQNSVIEACKNSYLTNN
ncbi:hypothetical protein AVEN_196302-1 [Araneus ventricosus]|uniref:Uncharacterized protein n=1 Tax=Araneus ventricosus TaxID=182803 RepID=A0A4Y2LLU0_ARAVE|nr:hypothetical protein AVEN_196302-1 [Araneus ventricosus]